MLLSHNKRPTAFFLADSLPLVLPLAFYVVAVFWRLGEKSLWLDEILVPLTAGFPVDVIIQRSMVSDSHPPGFHLLIKLWGLVSDSDAWLRTLPALLGVGAILACQRLGRETLGRGAGLMAAAALATTPLFISLARQVRPYTLVVLLCALLLLGIWREVNDREGGWPLRIGLCVSLLVHFVFFFVLAGLGLYLLARPAIFRRMLSRHRVLALCFLGSLGCSLSILLARMVEFNEPGQTLRTLGNVLAGVNGLLTFSHQPDVWTVTLAGIATLGLLRLFRHEKPLAALLLCYALTPLALLVLLRYSSYSNPWHYTFLLPVLALLLAAACEGLSGERPLLLAVWAVLFCVAAGVRLAPRTDFLYADEQGSFKAATAVAAPLATPGRVFVASDKVQFNALARYMVGDPARMLAEQRVQEADKSVELVCLGPVCSNVPGGPYPPLMHGVASPVTVMRQPVLDLSAQPESLTPSFKPEAFYSQVLRSEGIQVDPAFACQLMPTRNDIPGSFTYRFATNGPTYPYSICLLLRYNNAGDKNVLRLFVRFDGGEEKLLFATGGVDKRRIVPVPITRDAHFSTMDVRVELTCARRAPAYPGGNLETIQVEGLTGLFSCYRRDD